MDKPKRHFRTLSKLFLTGATVLFLCTQLALPVAATVPIETNLFPIPPVPTPLVVNIAYNSYKEISKKVEGFYDNLALGGITTLMNVFQVFTQRIAYDAAQRILSGDAGKYPFFWEQGFGDYLADVSEDAGNQFISSINSEFFNPAGFDLCTPIDPLKLQMSLGGLGKIKTLPSKCTAAQVGRAWEQTKAAIVTSKDAFDTFAPMFDPSSSELSVGISFQNEYLDEKIRAEKAALLERTETQGWKHVKNAISGNILTPADSVKAVFEEATIRRPGRKDELNYSGLLGNAFKMGFTQLGILTASTFLNTLASGLLDKLFKGLAGSSVSVSSIDFAQPDAVTNVNAARARIIFSDLLTPNLYSNAQRDFVTELAGCPTPRGLFNCSMDDALATALRSFGENGAYTVGLAAHISVNNEPPSNPAFLNKDWELIPESDVKNNTDPSCYQRAYCASNLAKLRYARILPVGWELAANSPYNKKSNGKYITLGQVIRGFNVCNDEGKADSTHPWCKLIDPNWVLTAPPFQCSIEGHGDTVFGGTGLRLQECADATSCLKRDDRGKCISGYGYCLAETPVWRFTADECLERFASCRTYQSSAGERVSYLRNTLDYGACSADNVGCMWYATKRDASDQSGATWEGDLQDGPRVYFDATVKTCSASSEGCTRLLEVLPGQSALNLVKNGSFEDSPEEQKDKLVAWSASDPNYKYEAPEVDEGSSEFDGDRSFAVYDKSMASERIMLSEVRAYTLSVYIRSASSVKQGKFGLLLPFLKTIAQPDIATDPGKYYRSAGCTIGDDKIPGIGFNEILAAEPDSSGWRRLVCSFVSNKETLSTIIMITGSNVLVDAIQLEESEVPTSYIDGLASGLEEAHLKVSPDEFACKGRDDDHPLCANYARMCTQQDTGCQGYRDINNPLAPEIPATLSAVDFCPAICVGYAEYRKQASTFDLGKSIDPRLDDPEDVSTAHFIPAYGQQCSLQDVGCEVFTNVEASELGGEEKASFNYVRACEKPGENTETYFTWEGSETTGYQLRTWSLIKQANSNPPRPKIIEKMGPDSILKDPKTCNDVSWQSGADADCRQFFDSNGNAFYAYFSQTVVSSPTCTKYRLDKSNAADCGKTGGGYDPITSQCIYNVLTAASRQCNAVNAGCRAYIGTTGRNTAVVLEERFQGATSTPFLAGSLSNEAILVGDQSLLISDPNPNEQKLATATVFPSGANQLYSLSFWAKTTKPDQPIVTITVDKKVVANFPMGVDWQRYEFGPFTASTDIDKSIIYWEGLPNPTFIDEIRIERLLDVTYAVKDSWTIPAQCDRTPEGLPEPRAMLGCRAYQDRDENPVNVRRFGHLCREDVVGCKAFIDTRDSEDPYLETFEITGTDKNTKIGSNKLPVEPAYEFESKYLGTATTTRVADRYIYLIDDAGARCDSTQASCRAFGKPKFSQTQMSIESPQSAAFETMYFIDDITQYESSDNEPNMLCRKDELFCDEFKSGRTLAYFRNPLNHTCEWKDKVLLKKNDDNGIPQDGEYSGWFMQGQDLPCYKNALSVGNTYLIRNTADVDYWGWVGMCPIEQSECTEFRDTNDTSDPVHPAGKPYFFIKNQRLDVSSCGGEVNLQKGCILFRDLSDARSRYSTDATYNKSKAEGDTPQVPIDCVGDPDNPFCRKCTNLEYKYTDDILQGCLPDKNLCPSIISKCKIDQNYCLGSPEDCSSGFCGIYAFLPNKDYDAQLKECESWKIDFCGRALKTSCELSDPESPPCVVQKKYPPFATAKQDFDEQSCVKDWDCSLAVGQVTTNGLCTKQAVKNDSNVVMKVRLDRDCAQWLGCATAETVFDSVQQKYIDICTETSVCDSSQGSNSGSFCANYVDRDIDPILKPGVFFTREIYTMRKTGFGEIDYSGYIVPEQFLAADVENRKVASEIFQTLPALENKYATDYRLAAAVHESTGLIEFGISNKLYPDLKTICRHTQTGRTGYYLEGIPVGQRTCYLAVDALSERTVSNLPPGEVDPRNIEQLSDVFRQTSDPELDTTLQRSFPPAECKAYPEGDSPFPNLYVKEWKTEFDPPRTEKIADGYGSANLCEYEEDCACSYRKVKYGGQATKYYSPFGKPPAGGICVGGRNDGGECVPGEKAASGSAEPNTTQTIVDDPACPGGSCQEISDVILVRGQFGQCLQRDYSRFVAGDPGRHPCLIWNPSPILASTFDTNHYIPLAGYTPPVNAGEYYCLSQADPPFENTWTALSHTNWDDSTKRIDTVLKNQDGANDYFYLPGKLSKFNYDTGYIAGKCSANSNPCSPAEDDCSCLDGSSSSDEIYGFTSKDRDYEEMYSAAVVPSKGDGVDPYKKINDAGGYTDCHRINKDWTDDDCDEIWRFQNLGVGIDGTKPFQDGGEGPQAQHCATAHNGGADKDHGGPPGASGDPNVKDGIGPLDNPPDADYNYGRWIQTGRGLGSTYTEYFVAVKPSGVAQWLYPDAGEDKLKELRSGAVREKNFAQFQFTPKCDAYTAACSIPTWYVDGVNEPKYTDAAQVANASKQVCSTFSKDFDGMLDRSKEDILVDGNKVPRKEKCTGIDGKTEGIEGNDERCYYKYWETDYRMDGVTKFLWLDDKSGESFYDRKNDYYSREAPCSKSGFSIRALFENASPDQNSLPKDKVKISQLSGPWNFIGFWISACTVGSNNYESALYLGLRVKHADICTDLAQVISPYTRESAAFADRVWNLGNFILPQLGLSYSSQYQPYGSALATGEPGKEPLFQTGGPVENYSKLNPPTFIGSGPSYVTSNDSPVYKWAHLTNLFARIYRVYKYSDSIVTRDSWACVGGINHGKLCPENATPAEEKSYCSGTGKCDTEMSSQAYKDSVHRCNGLSGVNAGLDCGSDLGIASDDPICHNAAVKRVGGTLEEQYTKCVMRAGWKDDCEDPAQYRNPKDGDCYSVKSSHEKYNAFGCIGGDPGTRAVLPGSGCTKPEDESKDCPLEVTGIPCIADNFGQMKGHCGLGYEHARCSDNAVDAGMENPSASSECVFTASQWWGAYDDGKAVAIPDKGWTEDQIDYEEKNPTWKGTPVHIAMSYPDGGTISTSFLPFNHKTPSEKIAKSDMSKIYRTKDWHQLLTTPSNVTMPYDSADTFHFSAHTRWGAVSKLSIEVGATLWKRWPTPHPIKNYFGGEALVRAGLCEGAEGADQDPKNELKKKPNFIRSFVYYPISTSDYTLQAGMCNGGVNDGNPCFSKSSVTDKTWWPHPNTCAPAQSDPGECKRVTKLEVGYPPSEGCELSSGDSSPDADLDEDNNSCTHNAGYQPRYDLCADPNSEKCLIGYDLGLKKQTSLDQNKSPAPTDVTGGLHTPSYLGFAKADPAAEQYISYYAPQPPIIAAPDLSRTCASPGSCPVSRANAFTLEDQSEGTLSFGGGKALVSLKFYGWASHEQTPLSDVYVDWGDGKVTKIEEARMRNKKPFCGGTKECELIPGLTCQSDADCPPAGGQCADRGTCSNNPGTMCFRDQECQLQGQKDAKCAIRQLFGNNTDACEANYFEFSHAYACDRNKLPNCGDDTKRCSRNPDIECPLFPCGFGDTCEAGLAPSGGCFDIDNVVCRYTPKVMLKDNWNWCTGECREGPVVGNEPTDISTAKVRHINGGCWDGTETTKNINIKQFIMGGDEDNPNECELSSQGLPNSIRPWVVYPGAVQIGIIQ